LRSINARYFVYRCLPVLAAIVLAGCSASGSEQSQRPQVQAAAQPDDDAMCQAQGFQPGSAPYVQCRKELDRQHLKDDPDSSWTAEREGTVRALLGRPPAGF
jgi:outer membrane biogenesis lipoprotein LolB